MHTQQVNIRTNIKACTHPHTHARFLLLFIYYFFIYERKKKRRVNFIPKFHSSLKNMYGTKVQIYWFVINNRVIEVEFSN